MGTSDLPPNDKPEIITVANNHPIGKNGNNRKLNDGYFWYYCRKSALLEKLKASVMVNNDSLKAITYNYDFFRKGGLVHL